MLLNWQYEDLGAAVLYYIMVNFASLLMMKCASATSQHIDGKLLTKECLEFVFFLTFVLALV